MPSKKSSGPSVRDELESIYRDHNPSMLEKIDGILLKYIGKEHELLIAVKKKYGIKATGSTRQTQNWLYVLKHFQATSLGKVPSTEKRNGAKWQNEQTDKELDLVRERLDAMAESIGGEIVETWDRNDGHRALVVQRKSHAGRHEIVGGIPCDDGGVSMESVKEKVAEMRLLIHNRKKEPTVDEKDRRIQEKAKQNERQQRRKQKQGGNFRNRKFR